MSEPLVDWGLARRVARGASGGAEPAGARIGALESDALEATCKQAERLVSAYSGLLPLKPIPAPEPIGRAEWTRAVLATLEGLTGELEGPGGIEISLPGPLGGIARRVIAAAGATEIGLAVGYVSRRVLGQYDVTLVGAERTPRLLFVAPNLTGSARELGVELPVFVRWVALHETTHALQFSAAPWLREHLGELIRELLTGMVADGGLRELVRRIGSDPKGALQAFREGDLASTLAGSEQAPVLERVQATMTVIEGHAEHVMDAAGGEFVPDVGALRSRLEARRRSRGPIETILMRALGLDLKLRQYELGKSFCDAVAERDGTDALNRIWESSWSLPERSELEDPQRWLDRTSAAAPA